MGHSGDRRRDRHFGRYGGSTASTSALHPATTFIPRRPLAVLLARETGERAAGVQIHGLTSSDFEAARVFVEHADPQGISRFQGGAQGLRPIFLPTAPAAPISWTAAWARDAGLCPFFLRSHLARRRGHHSGAFNSRAGGLRRHPSWRGHYAFVRGAHAPSWPPHLARKPRASPLGGENSGCLIEPSVAVRKSRRSDGIDPDRRTACVEAAGDLSFAGLCVTQHQALTLHQAGPPGVWGERGPRARDWRRGVGDGPDLAAPGPRAATGAPSIPMLRASVGITGAGAAGADADLRGNLDRQPPERIARPPDRPEADRMARDRRGFGRSGPSSGFMQGRAYADPAPVCCGPAPIPPPRSDGPDLNPGSPRSCAADFRGCDGPDGISIAFSDVQQGRQTPAPMRRLRLARADGAARPARKRSAGCGHTARPCPTPMNVNREGVPALSPPSAKLVFEGEPTGWTLHGPKVAVH